MTHPPDYKEKQEYQRLNVTRADRWIENSSNSLDQILLILSTGSFVLSITFLAGKTEDFNYVSVLLLSWGILFLAIGVQAFRYWSINKGANRTLSLLNAWGAKWLEGDHGMTNDKEIGKWNTLSRRALYVSALLTFVGVTVMFIFGILNVTKQMEVQDAPHIFESSLEEAAKNRPRGSLGIPAQWFMMESLVGWEKMMLIFGYADNVETCQHLLDIARSESPERNFRCEDAN